MSYESACNALEIQFTTEWANATPIGFENDGQIPPASGNYVELRFEGTGKARQASMGAVTSRYRDLNVLWITIYTPKGSGAHTLRALSDTVIGIFRGYTSSGLICKVPRLVGPQEEDREWVKQLIMVPWHRDEIA